MTFPLGPVIVDRPSRPLPRVTLTVLGVGAIAFFAGLQLGGGPSGEAAAMAPTSSPPTLLESPSPSETNAGFAAASPLLLPPGSSRFVRTFDATKVIEALPGGANCAGDQAGWMMAPQTGTYPHESFVKTWLTSCPIAPSQRDAFLNQVLEAIAPVDRPRWDGGGRGQWP